MPRVRIGPTLPNRAEIDVEVARLRDLDVGQLQSYWRTMLKGRLPPHLSRHLLFRIVAYRLQANRLGELDGHSRHLLDHSGSPEKASQKATDGQPIVDVRPGTILAREWRGRIHRVVVRADGFAWGDKIYPSL